MRRARALGWLVLAGLAGAMGIGCVTPGGAPPPRGPAVKAEAPGTTGDDVPLVPLPPLPLPSGEAPKPKTPLSTQAPGDAPMPRAPIPTRAPADLPAPTPGETPVEKPATTTAQELYEQARKRYAGMGSYIVRLQRREMVNGRMGPDEVILFKFRDRPWSAYLKWLGKEGQGREVVYVKGQHGGKIHTLLAAGDIPLVPAGRRMALSPDSVLVRSACRHPITEAGIGACIDRIGAALAGAAGGAPRHGSVKLVGPVSRPELPAPAWSLEHTILPGHDPNLEKGGRRAYFFDPETQLPMLIMTWDERGREVEYYRYDRLQPSVNLDDDDFNPDRLWGKPKAAPGK